jgi:hypothetical protein
LRLSSPEKAISQIGNPPVPRSADKLLGKPKQKPQKVKK